MRRGRPHVDHSLGDVVHDVSSLYCERAAPAWAAKWGVPRKVLKGRDMVSISVKGTVGSGDMCRVRLRARVRGGRSGSAADGEGASRWGV